MNPVSSLFYVFTFLAEPLLFILYSMLSGPLPRPVAAGVMGSSFSWEQQELRSYLVSAAFWIKRCSLRLLKCIWSYRLGGMMDRCARLMQRKRWLHDSRGTLQNTGHLCSDLYIEKSDTESAPAIFQISHFNESHLYVHDFTVHRGRTSIEAGGISLKVSDWLTSSGSTSFCLCISLPLLFLLHACESNYRLSFLVKKIQISIIESRWCGSMCVCGGEGRRGVAHYRTFVPEWGLCYEVKWALHGASWRLLIRQPELLLALVFNRAASRIGHRCGKEPERFCKGLKIMAGDIHAVPRLRTQRADGVNRKGK